MLDAYLRETAACATENQFNRVHIDLENRLSRAMAYYAFHRPHTALGNRTPAMAFLGESRPETCRLPRGRRGEAAGAVPFQVAFLTPDRGGFPVLAAPAA